MNIPSKVSTFIPHLLLDWYEAGVEEKRFRSLVAFADISGFTAISAHLAQLGKSGAELLTSILNNYFTQLINAVHQGGGFIGKFGGDAMTIFFPFEVGQEREVLDRGIRALAELHRQAQLHEQVETPVGSFYLRIKVGVAIGEVLFRVVSGEKDEQEYLLAGYPLDQAAEAESRAQTGEVIAARDVVSLLDLPCEPLDTRFFKITISAIPSLESTGARARVLARPSAQKFIDPAVYRRLLLGLDTVGEIRLVSVLFFSFEGLDYDFDPEVGNKLQSLYQWLSGVIHRYNGSINKMDMGDKGSKVLITFGAPEAHENKEQLAVLCGLELISPQSPLAEMGIVCRGGLASGVAFAGEVGSPERQEYTVMGPVVNLAARLMTKARSGELWVDKVTYEATEEVIEYGQMERASLKGFSDPVEVRRALGLKRMKKGSRVSLPLIDREEEKEKIEAVVNEVYANKRAQVLVIRGPAGCGKTRLGQILVDTAERLRFTVGSGEALSYAKRSPYLVWISILRGLLNLVNVPPERSLRVLERVVEQCDPEHTFRLPIIAGLLGIPCPDNEVTRHFDASLRQENLYDFIVHYLRFLAQKSPVLILVEDAQWIDRSSLDLIAYLLRNLARFPVMFAIIRRPYARDFVDSRIKEIEGSPGCTFVEVRDFDLENTALLMRTLLRVEGMEDALLKFVFEASQGNPAFVRELINHLQNQNLIAIKPTEKGLWAEASGDLSRLEVPNSLNGLIMSQIDHLPAQTQLTVKLAAVIGRRFGEELLIGSYPVPITPEEIERTLKELQERELVSQEGDSDLLNYIFKNLLTREVAYESLLFAHRREYHRRVGLCLEALVQGREKEWCEELARHFEQTEDDARAAQYLLMAGDKAFDLYANESAEVYYQKALERTSPQRDPSLRMRLLTMKAKVAAITGKPELQRSSLEEALALATERGDLKAQVNVLDNLAQYYYRMNDPASIRRVTEAAIEILNQIDHPYGWVTILSKVGALEFMEGHYEKALESWIQSSQLAEKIGDLKGLSMALSNCGLAYKTLGDFERSLECYHRSITIDRETGNLKSEAVNLGNLGVFYHQRGDFNKALECYLQALELGRKIGSKEIQVRNMGSLAVIYQMRGERARAKELLQQKLELEEMMNYKRGQVFSLGHLGEWFSQEGEFETASEYLQRALKLAESLNLTGEIPWLVAELGCLEYCQGNYHQALTYLQKALQMALQLKRKVETDYARRHLGLVLIEMERWEEAGQVFSDLLQSAQASQGRLGMAAGKIGLGAIRLFQESDDSLIEEGMREAREIGDPDLVITGLQLYAKILIKGQKIKSNLASDQIEGLLNEAEELARSHQRKRELIHIGNLRKIATAVGTYNP